LKQLNVLVLVLEEYKVEHVVEGNSKVRIVWFYDFFIYMCDAVEVEGFHYIQSIN
jgi:hypothetical protein